MIGLISFGNFFVEFFSSAYLRWDLIMMAAVILIYELDCSLFLFFFSSGSLCCITEHVLSIEADSSLLLRLFDSFTSSLQESSLLELDFSLDLLSLHIWDEE